jgi:hypothetical protein
MSASRWLWSLDGLKKLKMKEIREWKIVSVKDKFVVEVYGFFGGAVDVFDGTLEECKTFINNHTEGRPSKKEGEEE